ncbi:septal ring lytic transglycosylase RlpA family protein [Stigmatella erecta]|uniref:Rare lipoprotein A n=1 Tax=Stigmatella erecta TaxID=83460 RepID=A0A1I0L7P6_9BACT|nr:septal ring lytic transglycosylase RlpA family protein [Stigmatella erecta]SEU35991.1 rare lipoprotein A [Stigmatella erecta]
MNMMNRLNLHRRAVIAATLVAGIGTAAVLTLARPAEASVSPIGTMATCQASWYGAVGEIPEGWPTASGEPFHRMALKAAHNSFPFGTQVKVTYGTKSVIVTINDRGGFGGTRCLDLTYGAFIQLANPDLGVINVQYQVL